MISVSANWIAEQLKQIRGEGNVRLTFENGDVLTKEDIFDFSYIQSGDTLNRELPLKEISFQVLNSYVYNRKDKVWVEFAFYINGAYEWVMVGLFFISEVKIKQNDIYASYKANQNFLYTKDNSNNMKLIELDSEEIHGSAPIMVGTADNPSYANFTPRKYVNKVLNLPNDTNLYDIDASCGLYSCSKNEIFQLIGGISGKTFNTIRTTDNPVGITYSFKKNNNSMQETNYDISLSIQSSFPEFEYDEEYTTVSCDYYANGGIESETISINVPVGTGIYRLPDPSPNGYSSGTSYVITGFILVYMGNYYGYINLTGSSRTINVDVDTRTLRKYGEQTDFVYSNPIMDEVYASYYAKPYFVSWLPQTRKIVAEMRIDPRLELFDYVNIQTKDNSWHCGIVEYIKIAFNGAFTGKVEVREVNSDLLDPVLSFLTYDENVNYSFKITNNNNVAVRLFISYSQGKEIEFTINANGSLTLNNSNAPELWSSFDEKVAHSLGDDIYCHFEYENNKFYIVSDNTIILEAD